MVQDEWESGMYCPSGDTRYHIWQDEFISNSDDWSVTCEAACLNILEHKVHVALDLVIVQVMITIASLA